MKKVLTVLFLVLCSTPSFAQQSERPTFPNEALGFSFGSTIADTRRACQEAGHSWSVVEGSFFCSGPSSPIGHSVEVGLSFNHEGRLNMVVATTKAETWARTMEAWVDLRAALISRYGNPEIEFTGSDSCRRAVMEQENFSCLRTGGEQELLYVWENVEGGAVLLKLGSRVGIAYRSDSLPLNSEDTRSL